jgi:hypothetical protein
MNHHDADVTDVVVVLEELDDDQTLEVVKLLEAVGMIVQNVDNENSVVEGSIVSQKVRGLDQVEKVVCVRSVRTYVVDYPPGDPRDLDGPEEVVEDSED